MSGTISPELNVGFKHISFDNQLKQRYGVNFLASYYASPLVRILENDQNSPDLPYFSELKPMLRNATGYRFVEWKTDKGTVDWKYVVTSSEDRPAGDGKYLCHKKFSGMIKINSGSRKQPKLILKILCR